MTISYSNALSNVLLPDCIKPYPPRFKTHDKYRIDSTVTSAKVARYILYIGIGLSAFGLYRLSQADDLFSSLSCVTVGLVGLGIFAIGCDACHTAALYLQSTLNGSSVEYSCIPIN